MSSGMPVYFGSVKDCIGYFSRQFGIEMADATMNPAEFVVDIAAQAAAASSSSSSRDGHDHRYTTQELCAKLLDSLSQDVKDRIRATVMILKHVLLSF